MPSQHSSIVGGSSAARILNCPGSVAMQASLPPVTNRDSIYSIEGTALHSVMELLITGKTTLAKLLAKPITVNDIEITEELVNEALRPAMVYWEDLITRVDTWQLETKVEFPGIEGAFGTADVIARDDIENITYITDWKFGAGEAVKAVYEDEYKDVLVTNEQLMFYACGANHTQPEYFPPGCRVVLTVVQPRARGHDPITSTEVSMDELYDFEEELRLAVDEAGEEYPITKKGRWCRFQNCQTICPHHTGPLVDLKLLAPKVLETPNHLKALLHILEAAPIVENLIREARTQAHLMMSNGESVPGWKLVAKRANRQWTVDVKALAKKLRLPAAKLYDTKLKSPAGVEKMGVEIPAGLAVSVSSGTTIAPVSDKRPAISGDPKEISKIILEILSEAE
jgi:Protein of unknown function (DUF2800)